MPTADYHIVKISYEDIDSIKPLWEKLNTLHFNLSPNFKSRFKSNTWEKRKNKLFDKSHQMLIEYAVDHENRVVGYCISTIDKTDNSMGEIDSIFIEKEYRGLGIGKELMNNAINWLNSNKIETQRILVGAGNEGVLKYYQEFDFYPLHIVLQKVEK